MLVLILVSQVRIGNKGILQRSLNFSANVKLTVSLRLRHKNRNTQEIDLLRTVVKLPATSNRSASIHR